MSVTLPRVVLIAATCLAAVVHAGNESGFCCPQGNYGSLGQASYGKKAAPAIDYDGDPYAYAPDDSGRDHLSNAGHPGNWWGVRTDNGRPDGRPLVVQLKNPDTNKLQNYYISQIIGWKDGKFIDVLDAKGFAYVVLTTEMEGKSIRLGDWVQVANESNSKVVCARVEDRGNGGDGGEISECAADELGILYNRDKGVLARLVISAEAYPQSRSTKGDCND
jgi:hypothetical protein